jgi:hypothetical protein
LVSLLFVTPLLIAYEGGLLWLGPAALRNGADLWLRRLLELAGFSQYFLLPGLTVGILLAWHHVSGDRWSVRAGVLFGMLVESLALGAALLAAAHLHQSLLAIEAADSNTPLRPRVGEAISYLGAGIYEELVFRLIALTGLAGLIRWSGCSRNASWLWSIYLSSLAFAAAHYPVSLTALTQDWTVAGGEAFGWSLFCFRFFAGVLFCVLFLTRGFGIAVGAHAVYDILVGC